MSATSGAIRATPRFRRLRTRRSRRGTLAGLAALTLLALFPGGCARAPLAGPEGAMRATRAPELADDLPLEGLLAGIEVELPLLDGAADKVMVFGPRRISQGEYARALRRFLELARATPDRTEFLRAVAREFDFAEVYGNEKWGQALVTSYYEPRIDGSLRRTERFTQPLYRTPPDLLDLDLTAFDAKYANDRKLRARLDGRKLVPYFNREQIDAGGALHGKGLEICWVDPLDAFFLQVQGSGTVALPGGEVLRINYAEKNGQPYESIGKFVRDRIPPGQLNSQMIEAYLRGLPPGERQAILNLNPSYVFFQTLDQSAITLLGVPAVDGRTIATDRRLFPKGALAFLTFDRPRFAGANDLVPADTAPTSRFVLDQDTGGAILGGGRVDLFWGRGGETKRYAGAVKSQGRLVYLLPKGA